MPRILDAELERLKVEVSLERLVSARAIRLPGSLENRRPWVPEGTFQEAQCRRRPLLAARPCAGPRKIAPNRSRGIVPPKPAREANAKSVWKDADRPTPSAP